ncbi:MAG TPA: hypothetical protein VGC54_06290 [Planctomycetota bacterium]
MNAERSRVGLHVRRILAVIVLLAILGFGTFAALLTSWSELRTVAVADAEAELAAASAVAGAGPPLVTIAENGSVSVNRELEGAEALKLKHLHLLVWEPGREKLLRIDFPWWFAKVKMTHSLNLGTLTTVLAGDWKQLDLKITEDDLERCGPGLVLDHVRADGGRILLWTSAAPAE